MKRILTSAVVIAATISFANNANAAGRSSGCGLGSKIFSGEKGAVPNILAVTTNGTSGNQTFGITSGTLGCNANDVVASNKDARLFAFANQNLNEIAADAAKGEGEYLESVAAIMEIKDADKDRFFKLTQSQFSDIFSSTNTNTKDAVIALNDIMKKDEVLKAYAI